MLLVVMGSLFSYHKETKGCFHFIYKRSEVPRQQGVNCRGAKGKLLSS